MTKDGIDSQARVPAYVFGAQDVWNGLQVPIDGKPTPECNGLVLRPKSS